MESTVGLALLGRGTVGGGVAGILEKKRTGIERRTGARFTLHGIADRSTDPFVLTDDPRVDIVIETIGGTAIALECIERALERRKHVVTANKDVIATQGPRLRAIAAAKGVTLRYEAAVASAIPILSVLEHSLGGDEILEIGGVLSGTCNYILDAMREGRTFAAALKAAQEAGYAEADPKNDIEAIDASHKLAVLIQHAFGEPVTTPSIPRRGIVGITSSEVRHAHTHCYELKLFAQARKTEKGITAEVGPVLIPFSHPFAKLRGVENAVSVVADSSGPLLFTGAGAGRKPSSAAVVSDLVAAIRAVAERRLLPRTAHVAPIAPPAIEPAFANFPSFAGFPILDDTIPLPQIKITTPATTFGLA